MNQWRLFMAALACTVSLAGVSRADDEQAALDREQQKMEEALSPKPEADKARTLSTQFKVEPSVVEGLRAKNRGWGEIGIELAMAEKLQASDPAAYPTFHDALAKLETQRADGSGWGKIAKDLGMKLGPIVSDARHARNAMRAEQRIERRQEKMDQRQQKMENRMDHQHMRAERVEKAPRPEKAR